LGRGGACRKRKGEQNKEPGGATIHGATLPYYIEQEFENDLEANLARAAGASLLALGTGVRQKHGVATSSSNLRTSPGELRFGTTYSRGPCLFPGAL